MLTALEVGLKPAARARAPCAAAPRGRGSDPPNGGVFGPVALAFLVTRPGFPAGLASRAHVLADAFEPRDALSGDRFEPLLERGRIVGHQLHSVAGVADLDVEGFLRGQRRMVRFRCDNASVDRASRKQSEAMVRLGAAGSKRPEAPRCRDVFGRIAADRCLRMT